MAAINTTANGLGRRRRNVPQRAALWAVLLGVGAAMVAGHGLAAADRTDSGSSDPTGGTGGGSTSTSTATGHHGMGPTSAVALPPPVSTVTAQTTVIHIPHTPVPSLNALPSSPPQAPDIPPAVLAQPQPLPPPAQVPAAVIPAPDGQATPPPVVSPALAALQLSEASIHPGGDVTATGLGCAPNAPVSLSAGDVPVGTTVAGPQGEFQVALATAALDIGRHQVIASCGPTLSAIMDVVLVSRVGTGSEAMTLILIFLLTGVWFFGHRLFTHPAARRTSHA